MIEFLSCCVLFMIRMTTLSNPAAMAPAKATIAGMTAEPKLLETWTPAASLFLSCGRLLDIGILLSLVGSATGSLFRLLIAQTMPATKARLKARAPKPPSAMTETSGAATNGTTDELN